MKHYNFVYQIQSHSNPDKKYTIKMDDNGLLSCNCPSWIFNQRRDRTCKHIDDIRRAGFTVDGKGRFITGTTHWGTKVPVFCKSYPDKCDECGFRFMCFTEKEPEFNLDNLKEEGITKQ
jgi:hypothetical protein